MPGLDKTGPAGEGPETGNAFGRCGSDLDRRGKFGKGRGMGRSMGRGMGRCFAWDLSQNNEDRAKALRGCQKSLKERLNIVEKELRGLNISE